MDTKDAMKPSDAADAYTALAGCYDELMTADYSAMADFIDSKLKENGAAPGSLVLELGCGTGSMTLELARRSYDMTALDLSPDMLMRASDKLSDAGIGGVLLLCQDMRSFELYGTVAAAVCALDGVNYLTDTRGLRSCFRNVYNYLDPGGMFIFDVNTPYKFREVFGNRDYILEGGGVYCGWQNSFDTKTGICMFELSVFRKTGNGWNRFNERQYEKCYGERALTNALTASGFVGVRFYSGYTGAPHTDTDERWVITAIKPAESR